jgi:hypothetical protein
MVKKFVIAALVMALAVTATPIWAADYSAGALKQIEELKILSRDKRDIPESFAGVKKISGDEVKKWIDAKTAFVLLDNRIPADFEKERIAGAKRLSPDDLMEKGLKAAEALGVKKTDNIVFY